MKSLFAPGKVEKFPEPLWGTVEKTIAYKQPGRVRCRGTSWPARFYDLDCQATVFPDDPVAVIAIEGIMLLVEPISSLS